VTVEGLELRIQILLLILLISEGMQPRAVGAVLVEVLQLNGVPAESQVLHLEGDLVASVVLGIAELLFVDDQSRDGH